MLKKGYIYILLTTLIFSSMEVILKMTGGVFHPLQITALRFFIGGLVLVPFAVRILKQNHITLQGKDILRFAGLGFLGMFLSMNLYQMAVQETKASVVAVLFSSNPIFVTILAFFLLREPIRRHHMLALILDIVGIVVIIDPLHNMLSPLGIALSLGATLLFAFYGVFGKRSCARFGGVVVTCMSFLLGSAEMFLMMGITHIPAVAQSAQQAGLGNLFANIPFFSGITLSVLPLFLFICIINTGVGFACYFKAMEMTSARETSLVFFFKPIIAPLFALAILGEEIPLSMMIGIVFILLGSLSSILPDLLSIRKKEQVDSVDS